MFEYLLRSSSCLAVLLLFYALFLERESLHRFKRLYLLLALVASFGIPLVSFTQYVVVSTNPAPPLLDAPVLQAQIRSETGPAYLPTLVWITYGTGVLVFTALFFKNLGQVLFNISRNTTLKKPPFTLVLLENTLLPYTFFNYIFLNKRQFKSQQIPREVLWHEETHARQKHSLDILLLEILQVIFWFNPLIYLLKHYVKLNHEFLADEGVLRQGIAIQAYQNTLVTFSSQAAHPRLTNAINYSLIKKRLIIMKKRTTKRDIWLRTAPLLPLFAFLLLGFSNRTTVLQEKNERSPREQEVLRQKAIVQQKKEPLISGEKDTVLTEIQQPLGHKAVQPAKTAASQVLRKPPSLSKNTIQRKAAVQSAPLKMGEPARSLPNSGLPTKIQVDRIAMSDVVVDRTAKKAVDVDVSPMPDGKTATDHIVGLVALGAIFDHNGKEISGEEAISLAEVTDFVVKRDDGNPQRLVVYLSEHRPKIRRTR